LQAGGQRPAPSTPSRNSRIDPALVRGPFEGPICRQLGTTRDNSARLNKRSRHCEALPYTSSASGWGPEGRWFKSSRPDFPRKSQVFGDGSERSGPRPGVSCSGTKPPAECSLKSRSGAQIAEGPVACPAMGGFRVDVVDARREGVAPRRLLVSLMERELIARDPDPSPACGELNLQLPACLRGHLMDAARWVGEELVRSR
jgi:hypothetical protein